MPRVSFVIINSKLCEVIFNTDASNIVTSITVNNATGVPMRAFISTSNWSFERTLGAGGTVTQAVPKNRQFPNDFTASVVLESR